MFDELLNAMDMVGFLDEVMHEAVNTLFCYGETIISAKRTQRT